MDKGGVEIREEDRIPPPSHTHTACRPCPVIASPHLQLFATPQDSLRPPPPAAASPCNRAGITPPPTCSSFALSGMKPLHMR